MIQSSSEYQQELRHAMRGGNGDVRFDYIWKPEEDMHSLNRLYSKIILNPGCSIGYHIHENEEEIFFILQGNASADDNGVKKNLKTGDSMITRSGEGHSIACSGNEPLVILAVISCYPRPS